MKIGLFSDWHLRLGGKKFGGTWDKRLIDGLNVGNEVVDYFKNENIDGFIFLGDMFDRRYTIDFKILYGITDILNKLHVPGYFLVGNHDQYNDAIHSLKMLEMNPRWKVIDTVTRVNDFGLSMVMCPYHDDADELLHNDEVKKGGDLLVLHQLLEGFAYQTDYLPVGTEVLDYEKVMTKYPFIMSGHNHCPKLTAKILLKLNGKKEHVVASLGSVMQLCFTDEDGDRGCWVFDSGEIKFHMIESPRYRTVNSQVQIDNEHDYFRLEVPETAVLTDLPDNVMVRIIGAEQTMDRLNLGDKWDWNDALKRYVEKSIEDEKERSQYLAAGVEIMKEVGSGS